MGKYEIEIFSTVDNRLTKAIITGYHDSVMTVMTRNDSKETRRALRDAKWNKHQYTTKQEKDSILNGIEYTIERKLQQQEIKFIRINNLDWPEKGGRLKYLSYTGVVLVSSYPFILMATINSSLPMAFLVSGIGVSLLLTRQILLHRVIYQDKWDMRLISTQ